MSLLGEPTIVSVDPELNRLILQSEEKLFQSSYSKSTAEIMGRWSMLSVTGDIHRELRSIAVNFMNNVKLRNYFLPDIEAKVVNILDSWKYDSTFSAVEEGKKTIFATVAKNCNIMSFSGGPRLCPGSELAKLEMAVFLHHLVQRFDWELAEQDHPLSYPFLGFPKHLPIKIRAIK